MRIGAWLLGVIAAAPLAAMEPAAGAREFAEVVALQADAARGRTLFAGCVACHGGQGGGTPEGRVPSIAGQHARVIARQLIDYRHAARWDEQMEQVASQHNLRELRDIADLAAWVASLPPAATQDVGDGRNATAGRAGYQAWCAGCHGATGEGSNALLVPRLAGQHYHYLLRQFADTLEGRRPNMPPPHADLLAGMDAAALAGLADHLSRLGPTQAR